MRQWLVHNSTNTFFAAKNTSLGTMKVQADLELGESTGCGPPPRNQRSSSSPLQPATFIKWLRQAAAVFFLFWGGLSIINGSAGRHTTFHRVTITSSPTPPASILVASRPASAAAIAAELRHGHLRLAGAAPRRRGGLGPGAGRGPGPRPPAPPAAPGGRRRAGGAHAGPGGDPVRWRRRASGRGAGGGVRRAVRRAPARKGNVELSRKNTRRHNLRGNPRGFRPRPSPANRPTGHPAKPGGPLLLDRTGGDR